jgi:hypothetical protein
LERAASPKESRIMTFFSNLFRKRPPLDPEGWEVGDQAECITIGPWRDFDGQRCCGLPVGTRRMVQSVRIIRVPGVGRHLFLGFGGREVWSASAFRKVRPRADEAAPAERAFTERLRRQPAPAMPRELIREHQ